MSTANGEEKVQEYISTLEKPWSEENEKILMGPYTYLIAQPGKDIRKQLIEAFNLWLQVPEDALEVIVKVVGMLHTASLLVDDVEDNSSLRRGEPVAHNIFGMPQTINSANYVYFVALEEIGKLNNPTALKIYCEELINLHRGQGMDLYWRESLTVPTEEQYLEMVNNKTGGLFRLAWKLMFAASKSEKDFVPLVNVIGLLFQIHDDYMNLQSPTYAKNKGFCEDLTEGKFSFPIIHSIRADESSLQLFNILRQRTEDIQVKEYAVKYMKEHTKSFEYTKNILKGLDQQARVLIKEYGGNEPLIKILDKFNVWKE